MKTVTVVEKKTRKTNNAKSILEWTGYKFMGQRTGSINIEKGQIVFDQDNNIIGGIVVVDMTSIKANKRWKNPVKALHKLDHKFLENNLKGENFFDVHVYKTAKLIIISSNNLGSMHEITAKLTIKDCTETIRFLLVEEDDALVTNMSIDRTDYGINYKSSSFFRDIGNDFVKDHFDLRVSIFFQ